jgi:adenylosuccinate synthase
MSEFADPEIFAERLAANLEIKNEILTKIYEVEPLSLDEILTPYLEHSKFLSRFITETTPIVGEALAKGKKIVFEGAQGAMLDIDHGTYPFVTSSHPIAGGACLGTGVGPTKIERVIGVAKAYNTRVGAGVFPTEQENETGNRIRERGHEYGTTTGRPRRCGWLDLVALKLSVQVNGMSELAVSLLDVLSGFDTLKICTAYTYQGKTLNYFPSSVRVLEQCQPVYEELPGWEEEISDIRSFEELPKNAKNYVKRIAELIGIPVTIVSVGPGREQTIFVP